MNFRKSKNKEEPEINFIPLIDVMLVILIFLMATTTYSRFAELRIDLPSASASTSTGPSVQIQVGISADNRFAIGDADVLYEGPEQFAALLRAAAQGDRDPVVLINADAKSAHENTVHVMEAARLAGITRISFVTKRRSGE
jgi:biopolymer transport protein ExbD